MRRYMRFKKRAGLQKQYQELVGLFSLVNLKNIMLKCFITITIILFLQLMLFTTSLSTLKQFQEIVG